MYVVAIAIASIALIHVLYRFLILIKLVHSTDVATDIDAEAFHWSAMNFETRNTLAVASSQPQAVAKR